MANGSAPPDTVALGPGGHLRLPDALLDRLGWHEGDRLVPAVDEGGGVRALTIRGAVAGLRGILKPYADARSVADELIEERRREAERE
jgi:bifunctional DNA-binding transcriptional regulator/antitoxin component of YhaV-PrlF toxin-antitoxin module